ncbi:MAG: TIGR01777 family oxidoreductase [Bacteroidota bacterium]
MKILLAGGTGFIGKRLYNALIDQGHAVTVLSRSESKARQVLGQKSAVVEWDAKSLTGLRSSVEGLDAVVNLSGESIAARRWTPRQKERILSSRVEATRALVNAIAQCTQKPSVLVNQSAVGYYGNTGDVVVSEDHPPGSDFLSTTGQKWELEARQAEEYGVRVVRVRTGIVLGEDGGALQRMLIPFKLFVGGPIGSGRQWMSWIHRDDEAGIIMYALTHPEVVGAVNGTAPEPLTNREFSKTLARVLRRPCWAPVPAFFLKVVLGEMAQSLLLSGQRVLPEKMIQLGYQFRFPRLEGALEDILK